jgi:hypothetical protein
MCYQSWEVVWLSRRCLHLAAGGGPGPLADSALTGSMNRPPIGATVLR